MRRILATAAAMAAVVTPMSCKTDPPCAVASSEAIINAPATVVQGVILDVDAYPGWNPFIVEVTPAGIDISQVGAEFELRVFQPIEQTEVVAPEITVDFVDADTGNGVLVYAATGLNAELAGRPARLQEFIALDEHRTLYRTSEEFCTELLPFLPLDSVQQGFDDMTEALKTEAETSPRSTFRSVPRS